MTINRGEAYSLTIPKLSKQIKGESVDIYYVNHSTPLDPMNTTHHIAKVTFKDQILDLEVD